MAGAGAGTAWKKGMKIGLDGRMLTLKLSGIGRYSLNLCQGLSRLAAAPEIEILPSVQAEVPAGVSRSPRYISENALWRACFSIPAWAKDRRLDLYHATNYGAGPLRPMPVPWILTIHDLFPITHPEFFPRYFSYRAAWLLRRHISRADWLISDSRFTAEEMAALLGADRQKISVVHCGIDLEFWTPKDPGLEKQVLESHGLKGPYLLFVGVLNPRKNLLGLLKAFNQLVLENQHLDHRLVLAGASYYKADELLKFVRENRLQDKVIFTGFVRDESLPALYRGATAFVFPSFFEGFGFPALEAQAAGTPVIASNTSSIPEVCSPSTILVDPQKPEEIAQAIHRVLNDSSLRSRMISQGMAFSRKLNWQTTAAETLSVYKKLLSR